MPPPSAGPGPRVWSTTHDPGRQRWQIPPTTQLACDARASCVEGGADGRAGRPPVRMHLVLQPGVQHSRSVLSRPLAIVSAVLTGVLTGGMVLIDVVLVPFWRGAPPGEFRAWFTAHSARLRALLVPLGAAPGIACTASAGTRVAGGRRGGPRIGRA